MTKTVCLPRVVYKTETVQSTSQTGVYISGGIGDLERPPGGKRRCLFSAKVLKPDAF